MSPITHATIESLGQSFEEGSNPEDVALVRDYLAQFADPRIQEGKRHGPKCVCDADFLGLMDGTFRWGIAHGEGYCVKCNHPARMYHSIKDREGKEAYSLRFPLPWHPSLVTGP